MSTYHEVIATAFGTSDALWALEVLARFAERGANISAEEFEVTQLETGNHDTCAATFKSGLSRYWPALRSFFKSDNWYLLNVCVYVVGFHECYPVYSECYYKGELLASDGPTDPESDDEAYRAFVKYTARFRTHPEKWQKRLSPMGISDCGSSTGRQQRLPVLSWYTATVVLAYDED